ncbi:MAG: methyltransferase domain-containing protein [Actinomycetota bacterium]
MSFTEGHIEDLPFAAGSFDAVISNGVINLAPDKRRVFT